MTTLLRLLNIVRYLNFTKKKIVTKIHAEKSSADALLHPQAVFLTNQNYESLTNDEAKDKAEGMADFDQKMTILYKAILQYGRVSSIDIHNLIRDLRRSGTATSLQGLFVLQCCSKLIDDRLPESRQTLGDEMWSALKEVDVPFDVSHYNALLAIYLETDRNFSPLEFLEEMFSKDVKPNRVTFQRLILQFCKQGKVVEASQILDLMNSMKDEQLTVNEDILSSFVLGHFKNNDIDAAFEILRTMETFSITPTIKTYSAFMIGYAEKGDINSIKKILEECESKDIWVSDKILLNIASHLSLSGFTEYVDEVLALTSKGGDYAKEANKIIYKHIEKQQHNIAFKIFQTIPKHMLKRSESEKNFFIQTLINFNVPIDKSIEYCQFIKEEGINEKAFLLAVNKSIANNMYETSITLMKAWKDIGGLINEVYFYPILAAYGRAEQPEGIEKVLQEMVLEFDIRPSIYSLKTFVLPYLKNSLVDTLSFFLNCQITLVNASNSIVLHLLSENKIREAVEFMNMNYTAYKAGILKYSLIYAFKNTEDVPSFVWILHYIYITSIDHHHYLEEIEQAEKKYLAQQFVDSSILEVIALLPADNNYIFITLFRSLIDKGLSISPVVVEEIKKKLGKNMVDKVSSALKILKSEDLIPKPVHKEYYTLWARKLTDVEKLESMLKLLTVTNSNVAMNIKKQLLIYHSCNLNEKKVLDLLEDFEKSDTKLSILCYLFLIKMYINLQKVDEVEFWLYKCKTNHSDFRPPQYLVLRLATLFAEKGQIKKALNIIQCPAFKTVYPVTKLCTNLILEVSKYQNVELLEQFLDLLNIHKYITEYKKGLFEPLIKLYLSKNDREAALQTFYWAYNTYKLTPHKIELMKKCLIDGDEKSLQNLLKINNEVYGKHKTYFDLAIAYLENNDVIKAKDIIENKCSLTIFEEYVNYYAEKYYSYGDVNNLERLMDVLNSLKFDIENLCFLLLKSYCVTNDWEKSYNLWVKMQEDDINPSTNFVKYLALILKDKNMEGHETLQKFKKAIQNNEFTTARKLLYNLPSVYKSDCYQTLCRIYASRKMFSDVVNLWRDLTKQYKLDMSLHVAEIILSKMVKENEVVNIERIGEYLSPEFKQQVNYNYYLNRVYLESGCWNLYLKDLQTKLDDEVIKRDDLKMHNKTVVDSLLKHPEICEQFDSLAHKFLKKGTEKPVHALWIYYFLQKNQKTDKIFETCIKDSKLAYWLEVLSFSECKNDPDICSKLARYLQRSSIKHSWKLVHYSRLIKNCMKSVDPKNYEYALMCLKCAMLDCHMNEFDINLLADLQKGLEESGVPWPWSTKLNKLQSNASPALNVDDPIK